MLEPDTDLARTPPQQRADRREPRRRLQRAAARHRRWPNGVELVGEICFGLFVLVAIVGPWLPIQNPAAIGSAALAGPSSHHVFGTDELGRDVLGGIVVGAREAAIVGFGAALASTLVGTVIGAVAGYFGGLFDLLLMRVTEVFQVMPSLILATLVVALYGGGRLQVIIVIAALAWPQTARLVRGDVRALKRREFVDATRCLGIGRLRILAFDVVPNALAPVVTLGTLLVADAILTDAALAYLGVADVGQVSWGRLLNSGQQFILQAWWLSTFPGLAIMITVMAAVLTGDHLSSALSPRGRE